MPSSLHTVKQGECYVDSLAVSAAARGKGVGTSLLKWGEDVGESVRGSNRQSLAGRETSFLTPPRFALRSEGKGVR